MGIVIGLNCLLAALVFGLVRLFWHWRCAVAQLNGQLNAQLHRHEANRQQFNAHKALLSPQQMGYALTRHRTQIAETRLLVARWQMRSRQLKQTWQLLQVLRTVLTYRTGLPGLPGRTRRSGQRRVRR
jgi:hypothetical protein